jgi:hypothetical protein
MMGRLSGLVEPYHYLIRGPAHLSNRVKSPEDQIVSRRAVPHWRVVGVNFIAS